MSGYKLTDRNLGTGSFSEVFLAYARDRSKLAVKVIPRNQISGTFSCIQNLIWLVLSRKFSCCIALNMRILWSWLILKNLSTISTFSWNTVKGVTSHNTLKNDKSYLKPRLSKYLDRLYEEYQLCISLKSFTEILSLQTYS